ncbi:ribonuclease H2, subunit B [Dichomitus squalens]|uniref:Ribonuclease H2 subunit B n=1 Tax=Dichomitus squalens TaxID=114155 RepID=A0A4Q9N4R8_9APHY|nr:ribonuclease H2, subunit B [Dichomitus squalens]TBU49520.1 ribonuclease H2, subunit B [Dichomitus squalens]
MACHVGVLPADLLHVLSRRLEDTTAPDTQSDGVEDSGLCFLRLPHPRTGIPSLFLPYGIPGEQESTILEVQAVEPPNPRSWFLREEVVEDGKLLMMTPIDPAFILIPLLRVTLPTDGPGNFLPPEDLIEDAANKLPSAHSGKSLSANDVVRLSSLRCIHAAMRHVCDFKEISPEITVYRYSAERVQTYLRSKVERLSHKDVSEMSRTLTRSLVKDGFMEDGKDELLKAARLRTACDLVSQYLARDVYEQLLSSFDFAALDTHMKVLKDEAMAIAAVNMNAVEAKESKSEAKDSKDAGSDKKRKSRESTGVEKLKKANTKGMAKLSTFFQKK